MSRGALAVATLLVGCHAIVGIEERGAGGETNGPGESARATGVTASTTATGDAASSSDATSASSGVLSAYETAVEISMPVVYFRFEEDAGEVIDSMGGPSAKAYTYALGLSTPDGAGVERGVASGLPALGKANRFHGAADARTGGYLLLADPSAITFDMNRAFSVELWASQQIGGEATAYPISCAFVTDDYDIQGYWTELGKQRGIAYASASRSAGASTDRVFFQPFDPSGFHHYVHTYDGTGSKLYIDGVERDACAAPGCPNQPMGEATTWLFTIGGGWNGNDSNAFNDGFSAGIIDEVAIYDRALSAAEVSFHHEVAVTSP